ncbi:ATP-binding cassette domain-containing protein [Haliea sp. E17]|uniref:ATP-binding cassette domain-containing protein n=1 Tax=Haliea sp. E17 TaxID=3401576 RepID=UPI003AAC3A4C
MSAEALISVADVSYFYGNGALRKQILHNISVDIAAGEIVILTGPSGSGKTTLLTLVGALRSAQQGSLRVLGTELNNSAERRRIMVRKQIGYIFQQHNLLECLSIRQNVQMSLQLDGCRGSLAQSRIDEVLERVGLAEHGHKKPSALSGGQKQRGGIARALVNKPRIVLADEPTASLDSKSGRDVVELIQSLAREEGTAVVLVTHDNRILDVADRILHLEDGRMKTLTEAVSEDTSRMLNLLERHDPNATSHLAALALALARVAYADRVVTAEERAKIREILVAAGNLSTAEVDFVMELSLINYMGHRPLQGGQHGDSPFNAEHSRQFVESLYAIASADGEVSEAEIGEIEAIAREFGLQEFTRPA